MLFFTVQKQLFCLLLVCAEAWNMVFQNSSLDLYHGEQFHWATDTVTYCIIFFLIYLFNYLVFVLVFRCVCLLYKYWNLHVEGKVNKVTKKSRTTSGYASGLH